MNAWLAGFIDGEGHVGIHPTGPKYYECVCFIRNTHKPSIEHVINIFNSMNIRARLLTEQRARGKDSYCTQVNRIPHLNQLAMALLDFSITKQEHWQLMYEFTASRMALEKVYPRPYSGKEKQIITELAALNKRWTPASLPR